MGKDFSLDELRRRRSEGEVLIVVDGQVYNVTKFLKDHPGGSQAILESVEIEDAGRLMRGLEGSASHSHSEAAFGVLEQYYVAKLKGSNSQRSRKPEKTPESTYSTGFEVDLSKPLVAQVGYLGQDYEKWVHQPVVCKGSPRFFESELLEKLTKTVWWVVPLIWVPFVSWLQLVASGRGLTATGLMSYFMLGIFIWTLVEYSMHRFLFHVRTTGYWSNTFHYLLHGCHHKHPMDGYRLVFPPAGTAAFLCIFWPIVKSVAPHAAAPSILGGGILGYVMYDLTHYFLHHGVPFDEKSRKLKRYHMDHHFKCQTSGFGITSNLWDRIFGTVPAR